MPSTKKCRKRGKKLDSFKDVAVVRMPKEELTGRPPREVIPIGNVEIIALLDCYECEPKGNNRGKKFNAVSKEWKTCLVCGGEGKVEYFLPAIKVLDVYKEIRTLMRRFTKDLRIRFN